MNMDRIVNMVVNQVVRRVVNIVVDRSIRYAWHKKTVVKDPVEPAAIGSGKSATDASTGQIAVQTAKKSRFASRVGR